MPDINARCPVCHGTFETCTCTGTAPGNPPRLLLLADAIRRQPGEWSSRRAHRLYRTVGAAPGRRTARRDLAQLARNGLLIRHETTGRRYYTRKDTA